MAAALPAQGLRLAVVAAAAVAATIPAPAHADSAPPELLVSGNAVLWDTGSDARGAVYVASPGTSKTLVGQGRAGVAQVGWLEDGRPYTFRLESAERGRVLARTVVEAGSQSQTGRAAVLLSKDVVAWSTGTGSPATLSLTLPGSMETFEVLDTGALTAPHLAYVADLSVLLRCGVGRQRVIVSLDRERDGDGLRTAGGSSARCEPPRTPRVLRAIFPALPFTVLALLALGVVRYWAAVAGRA